VADRALRDPVEWSVATRCRRGEATSGDLAVVSVFHDGALVAGIDGLGHGSEAARAAGRAAQVIRRMPADDVVALAERCHQALRGTRGAAFSLARVSFSDDQMTWLGIGSVEGRVVSGDSPAPRLKGSLPLAPGVPGHELPSVRSETLTLRPGDVLILATDGVRPTFADSLDISGSPSAISERVLADDWKRPDDALVVTVRYLGKRS